MVHSPYILSVARCQAEWVRQDEAISRRPSASEWHGDEGSLRSASRSVGDQAEITPTAVYSHGDEHHHVGIPGDGLASECEVDKVLGPQSSTISTTEQARRSEDDRVSGSPASDPATAPTEGSLRDRGGPDDDPSQAPAEYGGVNVLSRGTGPPESDYPPSDAESDADHEQGVDAESSEGMIMFSIDEGILEPPSPPWPPGMVGGGSARKTRRKREKRVLTSVYVRYNFRPTQPSRFAVSASLIVDHGKQ